MAVRGGGTLSLPRAPGSGLRAALPHLPGALLRGALVAALVCAPASVLPGVGADVWVATLAVALAAGLFVLLEYGARTPALTEFRFAPPLNRLRFAVAAATLAPVLAFALAAAGVLPEGIVRAGLGWGALTGGPWTPVGLAAEAVTRPAALGPDPVMRAALAVAATAATLATLIGAATLWRGPWPGPIDRFATWTNLPSFEPAEAAEAADRIETRAAVAALTAAAAPAALTVLAAGVTRTLGHDVAEAPLALVWGAAVWAAAPGVLALRALALFKLARRLRAAEDPPPPGKP